MKIPEKLYNKIERVSSGSYDWLHPSDTQVVLWFRLNDGSSQQVILGDKKDFGELYDYDLDEPIEVIEGALTIINRLMYLWKPDFQIKLEVLKDRFEKSAFDDQYCRLQEKISRAKDNIEKWSNLLIKLAEEYKKNTETITTEQEAT